MAISGGYQRRHTGNCSGVAGRVPFSPTISQSGPGQAETLSEDLLPPWTDKSHRRPS